MISQTDRVRNEEVLHKSRRRGISYHPLTERRVIGLVTSHILRKKCLLKHVD
jgi:hypothetical protein